jgi:hypothetical protein
MSAMDRAINKAAGLGSNQQRRTRGHLAGQLAGGHMSPICFIQPRMRLVPYSVEHPEFAPSAALRDNQRHSKGQGGHS